MNSVSTYHFQGKNATIDGASFQIASPKEINRVSKLIRTALGLKTKHITNVETRMYNEQTNYDGYNNVDFVLPNNATYNVPGSGTSNSSSSSKTNTTTSGGSNFISNSPTTNSFGF